MKYLSSFRIVDDFAAYSDASRNDMRMVMRVSRSECAHPDVPR